MTDRPEDERELVDFANNLERNIPLRNPIGHGNWTDPISLPYGKCDDCLAIGNGHKPGKGKIILYDLVQLAKIIKEVHPIEEGFPEIAAAAPYLKITGCAHHLKRATAECFLGTFKYREFGKDALHTFARPQTLLWIELTRAVTKVQASYPVHPSLEGAVQFLEDRFKGIVGDYREKGK